MKFLVLVTIFLFSWIALAKKGPTSQFSKMESKARQAKAKKGVSASCVSEAKGKETKAKKELQAIRQSIGELLKNTTKGGKATNQTQEASKTMHSQVATAYAQASEIQAKYYNECVDACDPKGSPQPQPKNPHEACKELYENAKADSRQMAAHKAAATKAAGQAKNTNSGEKDNTKPGDQTGQQTSQPGGQQQAGQPPGGQPPQNGNEDKKEEGEETANSGPEINCQKKENFSNKACESTVNSLKAQCAAAQKSPGEMIAGNPGTVEACAALGFPIVSNEKKCEGQGAELLPNGECNETGGVGLANAAGEPGSTDPRLASSNQAASVNSEALHTDDPLESLQDKPIAGPTNGAGGAAAGGGGVGGASGGALSSGSNATGKANAANAPASSYYGGTGASLKVGGSGGGGYNYGAAGGGSTNYAMDDDPFHSLDLYGHFKRKKDKKNLSKVSGNLFGSSRRNPASYDPTRTLPKAFEGVSVRMMKYCRWVGECPK